MAEPTPEIRERDLQGFKYFERLLPLLRGLHEVGTERDRADQRQLHMDEYCVLVLLSLFNPILRSVRALQQASTLKKVQQKLGCPRTSLGAFSEAVDVFDPQRLVEIIQDLLGELPAPSQGVGQGFVPHAITAVDGSVVKTLATLPINAPSIHCFPVWSRNVRICPHMFPNRVGDPNKIASYSGSSPTLATGAG